MCGVIGYVGVKGASPELFFNGLKRLEYRGYDSAGIAMLSNKEIFIQRAEGKLINLQKKLNLLPEISYLGIGHTRWATHGKPTEINAHPHRSGNIVLLHNGIIENYKELKEFLISKNYKFTSETDTEVAAHLLHLEYTNSSEKEPIEKMKKAIFSLVNKIHGAYAFGIISSDIPETLFAVKYGSPLVIGIGDNENYIASGITALVDHTNSVIIMEDKEIAFLKANSVSLFSFEGIEIKRNAMKVSWTSTLMDKNGFDHFMLKEIHEQPQAVAQTINGRINRDNNTIDISAYGLKNIDLKKIERIQIIACGTSYYSGCIAKFYIEKFTKIPVELELASETRYKTPTVTDKTLCIAVSQSGETIDLLKSIKFLREHGAKTLAIVNIPGSSIGFACDDESLLHAGPEVCVASTKALSAQLASLILLGLAIAQEQNKLSKEDISSYLEDLIKVPSIIEKTLSLSSLIHEKTKMYYRKRKYSFYGEGPQSVIAYEGALKLKELSYIHAEGYAAGEFKHGPIALIDEKMTVVCLAPKDNYYEKTLSNIEEIKARGGKILAIGTENDKVLEELCEDFISVPQCSEIALPFVTAVPMHFFAYWIAVRKGTDVDQPRNLAKSVTVE